MISIPFPGSKRNAYKHVKKIVEENGYTKVYEPFGGSGVLSVNLYNDGLVEKAVINDYDKFFDKYPKLLDIKDEIVTKCYEHGFEKIPKKKLSEEHMSFLQKTISEYGKELYPSIARLNNFNHNLICFRRDKDIRICDFKYFQNDLTTKNNRNYLAVVNKIKRDSLDYLEFINKYKEDFDSKTLLILDPPYINTSQRFYKNEERFTIEKNIELISLLSDLNIDYIFFNSDEEFMNDHFDNLIEYKQGCHYGKNNGIRKDLLTYVRTPKEVSFFMPKNSN